MGACVGLTVGRDSKMALEYHAIAVLAGANNRYVVDVSKANTFVQCEHVLPPMGYRLTSVAGSPGVLRAAPGLCQQLTNAAQALSNQDSENEEGSDSGSESDD